MTQNARAVDKTIRNRERGICLRIRNNIRKRSGNGNVFGLGIRENFEANCVNAYKKKGDKLAGH